MNNVGTQATLGTRHRTNTNKTNKMTTQKIKKMSNTHPTKQTVIDSCAHDR